MVDDIAHIEDGDEWMFDQMALAKRLKASEKKAARNLKKIRILAAFMLFAFLVLAYRSEINSSRIDRNARAIAEEQVRIALALDKINEAEKAGCNNGLAIITKFNMLQDELSEIERRDRTTTNPARRDDRITSYEKARILPLPDCT